MRKIVVSEFVSLDGVIENPAWTAKYWNDEIAAFKGSETSSIDALLLGRITYEGFAQAWPNSKDEGAPLFNSITKYVVTQTLKSLDWNNSHAVRFEDLAALKQQPGKDILVYGSGKLVQSLIAHNLVDQYNLLVYPVVLGSGQRMFEDGTKTTLTLTDCKHFSSGVIAQIYQPAQN